jgi:hypothetical protein
MLKITIMIFTKKIFLLLFFLTVSTLISCDPEHYGKVFIHNETTSILEMKYKPRYGTFNKDTTINIQPNTLSEVFQFSGIGPSRDYDCCTDEFVEISLQPTDTSKTMTKDITDCKNWTVFNPNVKRNSSKEIEFEFIVTQSDIQ